MICTGASSLACLALSSLIAAPCLAATGSSSMSEEEVRTVLTQIKGLLSEQVQCLQKLTSPEGTEDARKEYTRISGELMKIHDLIGEERLILHFAQFREEEQEVIVIIQQLAKEITRLHKADFYKNKALRSLVLPRVEAAR